MISLIDFKVKLELLTGQPAPFPPENLPDHLPIFSPDKPLGLSQLNEFLLLFGYNLIDDHFFQYLIDGQIEYNYKNNIETIEVFEKGIKRFQRISLLTFGNIKYAFKLLSRDKEELIKILEYFESKEEDEFVKRPNEVISLKEIPEDLTYYLGYMIEKKINEIKKQNPENSWAIEAEKKRESVLKDAYHNNNAYLSYAFMDVYIATSMREFYQYISVNRIIKEIFNQPLLKKLNLRYFDPTQATCPDRIDKGLIEALMLKRASCTVYLIQESDTLGKDSELASTLAQGKFVIAYIPKVDDNYINSIIEDFQMVDKGKSISEILLSFIKTFKPQLAWESDKVKNWLYDPTQIDEKEIKKFVLDELTIFYDKRAGDLIMNHPLAIQVNLATGVANGVLVVREIEDCAKLIYNIVRKTLEFDIDSTTKKGYIYLKEIISNCILRVQTADKMLTNTFWNFYLKDLEE